MLVVMLYGLLADKKAYERKMEVAKIIMLRQTCDREMLDMIQNVENINKSWRCDVIGHVRQPTANVHIK